MYFCSSRSAQSLVCLLIFIMSWTIKQREWSEMLHLRIKWEKKKKGTSLGWRLGQTQQPRCWFLGMFHLLCQRPQDEIRWTLWIRARQQRLPSNQTREGPELSQHLRGFSRMRFAQVWLLSTHVAGTGGWTVSLRWSLATSFQSGIGLSGFRSCQRNISSYKSEDLGALKNSKRAHFIGESTEIGEVQALDRRLAAEPAGHFVLSFHLASLSSPLAQQPVLEKSLPAKKK